MKVQVIEEFKLSRSVAKEIRQIKLKTLPFSLTISYQNTFTIKLVAHSFTTNKKYEIFLFLPTKQSNQGSEGKFRTFEKFDLIGFDS